MGKKRKHFQTHSGTIKIKKRKGKKGEEKKRKNSEYNFDWFP